MQSFLWLMLFLPLAGSVICGALHLFTLRARQANPNADGPALLAGPVACLAMAGAFAVALGAFLELRGMSPALRAVGIGSGEWTWIDLGSLQLDVELLVDPLSAVLALVITGVGFLIHLYSTGYMKGDPGYAKFFAYLNLFVAAMLILVLSSNLMGLFVGWEGVGLCSYLLIGFWYEKGWPAEAGQKAFVANRIGDACFLVGSFLLASVFGTLDLSDIAASVASMHEEHATTLMLAALCLFGGCCGKSAQWPLFVWLPDAMAGPTSVSALIHAATMVTAGVYLVARLAPLYAVSQSVLLVIGCVGALTAFIGASSALFQKDIKKVLAYSTVSQLGYMFLALGVGAWSSAVFHLVTHAFFKGLLFLGSGSVIHAMHHEQDMTRMGGLRRHMPTTWITFVVGAAALSGLPLLSGYFSKDEILAMNFAAGGAHRALWLVGVVAAAMTAFYTWRMVALTFHGPERFDPKEKHPHESPTVMTVPLMVLALLALAGGTFGLPPVFHVSHGLQTWLEPTFASANALLNDGHGAAHLSHAVEWLLLGLGAAIALFMAHKGFHAYAGGPAPDEEQRAKRPELYAFLSGAWNIDKAYVRGVVEPLRMTALLIASLVDQLIIDGAVNAAGRAAQGAGGALRKLADGRPKTYALWIGSGAAALVLVWLVGGGA